jgi:hypothetical protein
MVQYHVSFWARKNCVGGRAVQREFRISGAAVGGVEDTCYCSLDACAELVSSISCGTIPKSVLTYCRVLLCAAFIYSAFVPGIKEGQIRLDDNVEVPADSGRAEEGRDDEAIATSSI